MVTAKPHEQGANHRKVHMRVTTQEIVNEIARERDRQMDAERYSEGHDDEHTTGELRKAAAMLAVHGTDARVVDPDDFDTEHDPWGLLRKHGSGTRALVIAAALIVAEIARMRRAGEP